MSKLKFSILIYILGLLTPVAYVSAGIIISPYKYAWSNNYGYINFEDVVVNDNSLSGYAWSENAGWINFSPTEGGVSNDGKGNLSGSAWGENLGYIDFSGVSINLSTGKFSGTATGSLVGTITFDCHYCDVETNWREAAPSTVLSPMSSGGIHSLNQISTPISIPAATLVGTVSNNQNNANVIPQTLKKTSNPPASSNQGLVSNQVNQKLMKALPQVMEYMVQKIATFFRPVTNMLKNMENFMGLMMKTMLGWFHL